MKIEFINNHIVIPVVTKKGLKKAILDTGNPVSTIFSDETLDEVSVCGIDFKLQPDFMASQFRRMINWNDISEFIKTPIDGIIGYDFLANNDIVINLKEYNLHIAENIENFDLFQISFFMNVPILDLKIQELTFKAVFDTGAMYSIINSNYSNYLSDRDESINDYNPMLGKFRANLYNGDITISNNVISNCIVACSPKYDTAMNILQGQKIQAFLGINALNGKEIYLSYKKQTMGLK